MFPIIGWCNLQQAQMCQSLLKSGSHYSCFDKGKKHIHVHDLDYHHENDCRGELSFAKKHNLITLMENKPPQPNVFNKVQWMITFYYVDNKILKELFLNKVYLFVWGSTIEKIKNGSRKRLLPLLGNLRNIRLCGSTRTSHLVQL
jgi:ATP/ADP translocase